MSKQKSGFQYEKQQVPSFLKQYSHLLNVDKKNYLGESIGDYDEGNDEEEEKFIQTAIQNTKSLISKPDEISNLKDMDNFIASNSYTGRKAGYYFTKGSAGLGFYLDIGPNKLVKVDILPKTAVITNKSTTSSIVNAPDADDGEVSGKVLFRRKTTRTDDKSEAASIDSKDPPAKKSNLNKLSFSFDD